MGYGTHHPRWIGRGGDQFKQNRSLVHSIFHNSIKKNVSFFKEAREAEDSNKKNENINKKRKIFYSRFNVFFYSLVFIMKNLKKKDDPRTIYRRYH